MSKHESLLSTLFQSCWKTKYQHKIDHTDTLGQPWAYSWLISYQGSWRRKKNFRLLTEVGSSPKKKGLSASMSLRTLRSSQPNCSTSSGVWSPMPWALTLRAPCNQSNYISLKLTKPNRSFAQSNHHHHRSGFTSLFFHFIFYFYKFPLPWPFLVLFLVCAYLHDTHVVSHASQTMPGHGVVSTTFKIIYSFKWLGLS